MRSMYKMENIDGVICIVDLDGDKSVTNDIENVIDDLARAGIRLDGPVIYKDSDGIWDEVLVSDNKFKDFQFINVRKVEDAIAAVKSRP